MAIPVLIDSHCHLNYDYAPKTAEDLVREAALFGVKTLVTIGVDIPSIKQVQTLSDRFPEIYHTIGVHPHEASTLTASDWDILRTAVKHPKCRGIGEVGLDYHYDHSPRETQKDRLREQLAFAAEAGLPVIIHSREAEEDLLEILRDYVRAVPAGRIPGVIHCFTGTLAFGEACLDLGFYISFSGLITFKNSESIREAARRFPLERLLVETDAPYLAPVPFRGKRCEPSMVVETARRLAEVRGMPFAELAQATTDNARRFFSIPLEPIQA
ncbi:MAG: hypothetical protein A2X94_04250 [Bdellovibrionales bacterium GWB1_55_8]|nr:MAG: hypothetical protein A2X94_04250 [Bdellovibrionales bacterium GWB1_55_8]